MNVYVREGWLSPAECEAAIKLFPPMHTAVVNVDAAAATIKSIRKSRAAFLPSDTDERRALRAKLAALLVDVNERVFHFDLRTRGRDPIETIQLAEYGVGEAYDWHQDIGPGAASLRKLGVSVQVTDPSEYGGGDLEMWGGEAAPRSQGTVVAFTSFQMHRVAPVTGGLRRSLVAWAIGATPFR